MNESEVKRAIEGNDKPNIMIIGAGDDRNINKPINYFFYSGCCCRDVLRIYDTKRTRKEVTQ